MREFAVGLLIGMWLMHLSMGSSVGWMFLFGVALAWEAPDCFWLYGLLLLFMSLFVAPVWLGSLSIFLVVLISLWGITEPSDRDE